MGKCRTTARMNVKRMKNVAKSKLSSSLEKARRTKFKVTSSYTKGDKASKDNHTFVALDHMARVEPATEWVAYYGPDRGVTQQEYMEMLGESYSQNTQSILWFGESWANRGGPMRWNYDPAVDLPSNHSVSAGYVAPADAMTALSSTVNAITTSNVYEEEIAELNGRITTLEAKIQELEDRLNEGRDY